MRTETQAKTKKAAPLPAAKKRNARIVKLEAGERFTGTFVGRNFAPWTNKENGEVKDLFRLHFLAEDGERVVVYEDAGLKNAMINSLVTEGEKITLVKLDKLALEGDRSVNQWDIYSA